MLKLYSRSQNRVKAMDIILRSKTQILVESQCSTFMFIGFTLGILICKASEGDNIIILELLSFKPCDFTPSEVTPQESEIYVICYSYIHRNI